MKGKHSSHVRSAQHYRWNAKKLISSQGHVLIRVGKSHPLANKVGYVYEHKLVVASMYGLDYIKGKVIRHKNSNKTDNRIENLEVLSRVEHNKKNNSQLLKRTGKGQFKPKHD